LTGRHGRREKRGIRAAPAGGIAWPHATQVLRIRRDTGPTRGPTQTRRGRGVYPEVAAHLRACGPCAEDLDGLLAAIRDDLGNGS
jgi:hypothetical protein